MGREGGIQKDEGEDRDEDEDEDEAEDKDEDHLRFYTWLQLLVASKLEAETNSFDTFLSRALSSLSVGLRLMAQHGQCSICDAQMYFSQK